MSRLTKIILVIMIISIVINVVFFISELKYRTNKKDLKDSVSRVENVVNELGTNIINNSNRIEDDFIREIKVLIEKFEDDEAFEEVEEYTYNLDSNDVKLNVGEKTFITKMPNNIGDLQSLVRKMEYSHNTINRMLLYERNYRITSTQYIVEKVTEIQTNIQVVYQKVDNLEKPKTWSFAIGIGGGWNGRYGGIDTWQITAHGLVFFKNMVYWGIYVGVENAVETGQSIGVMLGWKFN